MKKICRLFPEKKGHTISKIMVLRKTNLKFYKNVMFKEWRDVHRVKKISAIGISRNYNVVKIILKTALKSYNLFLFIAYRLLVLGDNF